MSYHGTDPELAKNTMILKMLGKETKNLARNRQNLIRKAMAQIEQFCH
jgi:hypothetical protein